MPLPTPLFPSLTAGSFDEETQRVRFDHIPGITSKQFILTQLIAATIVSGLPINTLTSTTSHIFPSLSTLADRILHETK
jgi:hypothetical protein